MAERVDHAARQREIALKATRLFSQVGYDTVTLSQVAETAGVARTILYRYFKDKRQVLDAAIRAHTHTLLAECQNLSSDASASAPVRMQAICGRVADALFERKDFFMAVYDFVLSMVRHGEDMSGRIYEFTKGTRALLLALVKQGVADGSFVPSLDCEVAANTLFGLLELGASRLVLGAEVDATMAKRRIAQFVDLISVRP